MNIVETWLEGAKTRHGSIKGGIEWMQMVSGVKIHTGAIYRMRDGLLPVPAAVQQFIINEVLLSELTAAGWDCHAGDFAMLRDRLTLPTRK